MSKISIQSPKLDKRRLNDLLNKLKQSVPYYTPEWQGVDETDPGTALLKIFSYLVSHVISRINQVPYKNFAAFLDMLGIKLIPAQPARVPLSFVLSEGTGDEVLIPARTQAAAGATEEHEELPFETEKNLLAVPSPLKQAISIDPGKDAIYLPPPQFLEGDIEKKSSFTYPYTIISTAAKESKLIQLDHVTELAEGDFLKIGTGDKIDYVIISAISGTIVTITPRLTQDFPVGTAVEKLTAFALFEGKNWQEHSIYLGHKDLFNVKSQAYFNLDITHHNGDGSVTEVTPLEYLWEYWGEKEGEEGEDWQPLNTSSDETNGLSAGGAIKLQKGVEGEIKEKEISGIKSRWLRCRLNQSLPVPGFRTLPVLDTIKFTVESSAADLLPEQAFNNEIPLNINKSFYPFGIEPRMFDTFAIAGKEIFSKKGAEVKLDVQTETRGITGPPAAIYAGNEIKVFARGTYGRLMELKIECLYLPADKNETTWEDHGFPPGGVVASDCTPAVLYYYETYISVFTRTENNQLVERFFNGQQWQWLEHGTPGDDITLQFEPSAIYDVISQRVTAFMAGSDGNLYEFFRSLRGDDTVGEWLNHGKPLRDNISISIASSPYAEKYLKETRVKVFFKGDDNNLYELDCFLDSTDDQWKTDYGQPLTAKVDSRPFAKVYEVGTVANAIVFVKGDDDQLWEFDTLKFKSSENPWEKLELPDGKSVAPGSNPHGCTDSPYPESFENIYIFVKDSDGCLWEWNKIKWGEDTYNNNAEKGWVAHQRPGNSKLFSSPFVVTNGSNLSVFSANDRNSIIERDITKSIWNEYKDPNEAALTPTLSWEYWNGKGWMALKGINDTTTNFLQDGTITFELPTDIEETEIAGQKNYWIRARIVGGDYGKETYSFSKTTNTLANGQAAEEQKLISTKDSIRPPLIKEKGITISYTFETQKLPEQCLTYNNLQYLVCTEEVKTQGKQFSPFLELEEKKKTLFLGFEKFFKGGPIRVFFDAEELDFTEDQKPKLEWDYSRKEDWKEITGNDSTESLIKADILEFLGSPDFSAQTIFGHYLYWLKANQVKGEYDEMPRLQGIYPNTTWAYQAETLHDEILGSSDGSAGQTFSFFKSPVWEGEEIRVMETLPEEEKKALANSDENAVYEVKDEKGNVTETWILWTGVFDFYDSKAEDRHYTIDRATGTIGFGDSENGMIPPVGENNIKAFVYQTGGGKAGNVGTGEITAIKSGVANIDSVLNPAAADGGADTTTLEQMLEIGPALISHRSRAVTPQDFEWLAKQASRKVVKARCLPNTNNKKQKEVGWVTVVIVPDSPEPQPFPSLQLRRIVKKHLESCSTAALSSEQHLYIAGPGYSTVGVSVQIAVTSLEAATEVERIARKKLDAFFHPLTGGPEGKGWDFGRNVSASDVYALLENIEGVDHVEKLEFILNQKNLDQDILEIEEDTLVSNGEHSIDIHFQVKEGG